MNQVEMYHQIIMLGYMPDNHVLVNNFIYLMMHKDISLTTKFLIIWILYI
jgi:hypothetical protein